MRQNMLYLIFSVLLVQKSVSLEFDWLEEQVKDQSRKEVTSARCICVPYYQCKDSFELADNEANIKAKNLRNLDERFNQCTGYLEVCCRVECGMQGNVFTSTFVKRVAQKRILGDAQSADFAEFPWMLGIRKGFKYRCGGSLIHPKVALTAAHCVYSKGEYTVRAGEWHWNHTREPLPHQDRQVESIKIHPRFNPEQLSNDIALLVLSHAFLLTDNVGIVCLPPRHLHLDTKRCKTSGWGKDSFNGRYQPLLKKLELPIVPRKKCVNTLRETTSLGPWFTLHESFLCAGGERLRDTCKGDGGSPLICPVYGQTGRYEQVGIVSWGIKCGTVPHVPGIYVNVLLFLDWIDLEMIKLNLNIEIYKYS